MARRDYTACDISFLGSYVTRRGWPTTLALAILLTNREQNCPLSPSRLANPRLANLLVLPTSKAANRHYVRFALFAAGISSDLLCALSPGTRLEPKARKLLL
jgi:hypothetical protein